MSDRLHHRHRECGRPCIAGEGNARQRCLPRRREIIEPDAVAGTVPRRIGHARRERLCHREIERRLEACGPCRAHDEIGIDGPSGSPDFKFIIDDTIGVATGRPVHTIQSSCDRNLGNVDRQKRRLHFQRPLKVFLKEHRLPSLLRHLLQVVAKHFAQETHETFLMQAPHERITDGMRIREAHELFTSGLS